MKLLDPAHPFFAPLWRRTLIVVLTLGWAVIEIMTGDPFWAILFGALGVYCAYQLLIAFPGRGSDDRQDQ
jgi:hypothetical protein